MIEDILLSACTVLGYLVVLCLLVLANAILFHAWGGTRRLANLLDRWARDIEAKN